MVEECLTFCSRYLHGGVRTRLNRRPRNDDECSSDEGEFSNLFQNKGRPLGGKKGDPFVLDDKLHSQAHAYILDNCDEVQEYVR